MKKNIITHLYFVIAAILIVLGGCSGGDNGAPKADLSLLSLSPSQDVYEAGDHITAVTSDDCSDCSVKINGDLIEIVDFATSADIPNVVGNTSKNVIKESVQYPVFQTIVHKPQVIQILKPAGTVGSGGPPLFHTLVPEQFRYAFRRHLCCLL